MAKHFKNYTIEQHYYADKLHNHRDVCCLIGYYRLGKSVFKHLIGTISGTTLTIYSNDDLCNYTIPICNTVRHQGIKTISMYNYHEGV